LDTRDFPLRHVRFPDPAGGMQDAGRIAELIRELGDNYDHYHEYLAAEVERCGSGPPDPLQWRGRYEEFCKRGAYANELFVAESMLRAFAAHRGASDMLDGAPLADERHRLFSARPSAEHRHTRRGSQRAAAWTPPPAPPGMPL
jgi:hypothetical protein